MPQNRELNGLKLIYRATWLGAIKIYYTWYN